MAVFTRPRIITGSIALVSALVPAVGGWLVHGYFFDAPFQAIREAVRR